MRSRQREDGRAGFTLVEVLVALVVAGILAAGVISLLMSQDRFYGHNDQHIYAQQTLRAAADLMASEIRMAGRGSPSDVVTAESDRLEVRFDLVRATVCEESGGDVYLYVYDRPSAVNIPGGVAGTVYSNPYDSGLEVIEDFPADLSDLVPDGTGEHETYCVNAGAPPGQGPDSYVRIDNWPDPPGPPERGAIVRLYGLLGYSFEESSFEDGLAVWRNNQELVAPLADDASFTYLAEDGTELPPPVSGMDLFEIRQIRLEATAVGTDARFDVERDLSYDIVLRN